MTPEHGKGTGVWIDKEKSNQEMINCLLDPIIVFVNKANLTRC